MAEVALGGAEQQRLVRIAFAAQYGGERVRLDRVAERGTGAVRLDEVDGGRVEAARPYAASRRARCASGLGAIRPLERPSELTAVARITASTRSPSRSASGSRLSTATAQPSLRPMPSASAEKDLQRPSGARAPALPKATVTAGARRRLTPAASAMSLSPTRRLTHAWWTATSDDEQAVSIAKLGPRRSST